MWHSSILFCKIFLIYQSFSSTMAKPLRGNNMHPADVPFIASITYKRPDRMEHSVHICSGSQITKNLVLTAAHCLKNLKYDQVYVTIGTTDLDGAKPEYAVRSWKTFERWAAKKNPRLIRHPMNDIAIIRLRHRVNQPGLILPNITPLKQAELYGKGAVMIGWISNSTDTTARFLKKVNVRILKPTECVQRYHSITGKAAQFSKGQFCSAASPFALYTCGDSGGPLLGENNDILGITRGSCPKNLYGRTKEFADERRFNLHTEFTEEYRQFIREMRSNCS